MEFPTARNYIRIIKEGQLPANQDGKVASAPIVLVQGPHNTIVGTGLPKDQELLLSGLRQYDVKPEEIEYVVCTHGTVENVGNMNLFPSATHIIGYNIVKVDQRILHSFSPDVPYEISDDIEVVMSPGHHDGGVVSVIVRNTPLGVVAVAGGVFHSEADLETPELWIQESMHDSDEQQQSRISLLEAVDHIIPRYGPFFRIPDAYKSTGVPAILTP